MVRALSLHHLTMLDARPFELVAAASAGNFDFCGIRLVSPQPGDPMDSIIGDEAALKGLEASLQETGVQVLDIEAIWLTPAIRIGNLQPAIEIGARLGAKYLLTIGFDPNRERLLQNLAELCKLAAEFGLRVMFEFMTFSEVRTLEEAIRVISGINYNPGLLIDALHFFRSGAKASDLAHLDPELFPYMQLCDAFLQTPLTASELQFEARKARLLPGNGDLPLTSLISALPQEIPLSLEAPTLKLANLPFEQRGKIAGQAMRRFLKGIT